MYNATPRAPPKGPSQKPRLFKEEYATCCTVADGKNLPEPPKLRELTGPKNIGTVQQLCCFRIDLIGTESFLSWASKKSRFLLGCRDAKGPWAPTALVFVGSGGKSLGQHILIWLFGIGFLGILATS